MNKKEMERMINELFDRVQEVEVEVESISDDSEIRICELEDTVLKLKSRITQLESD